MSKNVVLVLAGGVGSRVGANIPKQYVEVDGKPILMYCLEQFQKHERIDDILIAVSEPWIPYVEQWVQKCGIHKVKAVITGGSSRQHSAVNGLRYMKDQGYHEDARVLIHDAARPGVSQDLIDRILDGMEGAYGVLPVLPMKDAIYVSKSGAKVDGTCDRSELFAGQAPEMFHFGKYYELNAAMTDQQLQDTKGSSEVLFRSGLTINLVPGDEKVYKITTQADLDRFIREMA